MSKGDLNLWTDFVIGREAHGVCRLAGDRNSRERTPYRYRYTRRAKTASRVQHCLVSAVCRTRGAQLGSDALPPARPYLALQWGQGGTNGYCMVRPLLAFVNHTVQGNPGLETHPVFVTAPLAPPKR